MAAGPPVSERDSWSGRTLGGRYRIVRPLGTGGAGAVYEAKDTTTGQSVALKILHPELAADAVQLGRFRREAHAASLVGHPNIVRLLDFADVRGNDAAYLVLELVPGRSLAEILTRQPILPPARAVEIASQILAGLDAAHRAGIVHRDLKPGNVVMSEAGGGEVPKLVDFGIAQMHESPSFMKLTRTGVIVGTPRYMSPEQASGTDIDARTDVWAVGVMLYRMLTGKFPFDGRPDQIIVQIVKAEPPPFPKELGIPPALELAVRGALEKSLQRRWPTATAMQSAIRSALGQIPATAEARLPPRREEARTQELPMRISVEALGGDDSPFRLDSSLDRTTEERRPSFPSRTSFDGASGPSVMGSSPSAAPPLPITASSPVGSPPAPGAALSSPLGRRSPVRIALILGGAVLLGLVLTGCLLAPWIGACVGLWEWSRGGCAPM